MDRLLLRPTEAAEAIGIGRSKVYELLASGDLPSIRIGGVIRVPVTEVACVDRGANSPRAVSAPDDLRCS